MRTELLDLIRCPVCRAERLELVSKVATDIEVRTGHVKCLACGRQYTVDQGILDLLVDPDKEIVSEQEGWAVLEKAVVNTDELMLSLPDGIGEHKAVWQGMAANFHFMFSHLALTGHLEQAFTLR